MSTKTLLINSVLFGFLLSTAPNPCLADASTETVRAIAPNPSGLIAHYEFEGDAVDTSGFQPLANGTLFGNPTFVAGVFGQGIDLDGDGDYVDCGNASYFDITEQITVTSWIKVVEFDREWQTVIAKGDDSWRISRGGATNQLHLACTGLTPSPPWLNGSINVNDGKWHHAAAVYDGARMHLYVDGIPDASREAHGMINTGTSPVYIGENAQKTGRYFRGLIDELTIFNHALNADRDKAAS